MRPAASDERWSRRLVLDQRQLREGTVLRGNEARVRRLMQKLLNGEAVSIGARSCRSCSTMPRAPRDISLRHPDAALWGDERHAGRPEACAVVNGLFRSNLAPRSLAPF